MKENCYNAYNKNSAWKLKDGKQWKGSTEQSIKLRRLNLVQ